MIYKDRVFYFLKCVSRVKLCSVYKNASPSQPLILKISDKGIFNVTIKSDQSTIPSGLNFEMVFLNASSPNFDAIPPGAESNAILDSSTATGLTVPLVIEHVIPVKSFDIGVTSNEGQELLKK